MWWSSELRVPTTPMIQIRCKWGILVYCDSIGFKEHILKTRIFPPSIMPKTHPYTNPINKLDFLTKDISFASNTFRKAYPMWTLYLLQWLTRLINVPQTATIISLEELDWIQTQITMIISIEEIDWKCSAYQSLVLTFNEREREREREREDMEMILVGLIFF